MKNIDFFKVSGKFIMGMVHLKALPGTVDFKDNMEEIIEFAIEDAKRLEEGGVHAVIVENMCDGPFAANLDTEQRIALAVAASKVKDAVSVPVGIDAAFNDYKASLSIAKVIGADFVRLPVFVDNVEFYGGYIAPCAREAVLYRKKLNAENIKILADIHVKHTHMVLPHVTIEDSAKAAADCFADAIIVTGTHIGNETPIDIIKRVKAVTKLPVIAGSGVTPKNAKEQLSIADGAIVGSSIKEDLVFTNHISKELTKELMDALKG